MAARRVLVRRFGTIPTLGCVTVLCTDKTGTLTLNRMRLSAVSVVPGRPPVLLGEELDPDAEVRALLSVGALAGEPEAIDPMEVEICERARSLAPAPGPPPSLVASFPFSPESRMVRNVWTEPGSEDLWVAVKGAPEVVLAVCTLSAADRVSWEATIGTLAGEGYRVLGVARGTSSDRSSPKEAPTGPFTFLRMIALADPIRHGVPEAVRQARDAGIRVLMITGDHPETARAIARQAGWTRLDPVLTGAELDRLSPSELAERVRVVDIYARVRPEQKLRLVEALRRGGEVVAMTGDGVNDAPALRAANVGIAMGHRGTDVAREAAALILLDDAFPTVVEGVRTGRRVYDNMRKALGYIVAVHVAIGGMALLPVLLGFPVLLFPLEIVFLELIIDPVTSLVFEVEPEEPGVMKRPPRNPDDPLLSRRALLGGFSRGASILAMSLTVYAGAILLGHGYDESRSLGFAALIAGNLSTVYLMRSSTRSFLASLRVPNPLAWSVTAFGVGLLLLAIYMPGLATLFQFQAAPPLDLGGAIALGTLGVLVNVPLMRRWFLEVPSHHAVE